jgi:FtsP/CotA-like multicopper oxidase with cupredoxin domain
MPSKSVDGSLFSLLKAHSGLINGRGRYYYNYENGTHNEAPLEVFRVKEGSSYRFRVIAVGALYPFRVSVDDHVITVIESDGYPVQPVTVESFIISPGERYDFSLTANQSVGNYWIRGRTLETNRVTLAEAILRYDGAPEIDPTTKRKECRTDDRCKVLSCPFQVFPENENIDCILFNELKSKAVNDPAPQVINGRFREYFLNFVAEGMVNGKTFKFPSVAGIAQPTEITSQCDKTKCKNQRMCMCTYSIDLNKDDTVQIVLSNVGVDSGMSHPIHMHGHSFYVLKTGFAKHNQTTGQFLSQTEDITCNGSLPKEQNNCNDVYWTNSTWMNGNVPDLELQNPPRKDTISIPNGGYVVIRIKADNPGLWFLHCHIEFHATHGMGMVLNESFPNVPRVPSGFPTCSSFKREPSDSFEEEFAISTNDSNNSSGISYYYIDSTCDCLLF